MHGQEFSELKIPYNTVVAVDYANLESIGKISYCLGFFHARIDNDVRIMESGSSG